MRVAFVIVPDFVFLAHCREGGVLHDLGEERRERTVLIEGEGGRARIVATSPALRELGVRPRMSLSNARARVGRLWSVSFVSDAVEKQSMQLAGLLLSASPQIRVAGRGAFWVGADGCRLLGGELALFSRLAELVREADYPSPRIGIADTVIAARAAALFGLGTVEPGKDTEAMAPLPLTVLPLEAGVRECLRTLGIRTVGAFGALPSSQISARFGSETLEAHRMARGEDPRTVPVLASSEAPTIEVDFEVPFSVVEPALFVLQGGLERLMAPHLRRGFGVRRLGIELALIDGSWTRELCPADPVTRPRRLLEMCRAVLQDIALPSPMTGLRVEVLEVAPGVVRQDVLWSGRRRRRAPLDVTLMRLQSRLGVTAVKTPGPLRDSHLPEGRARWLEARPDRPARPPAHIQGVSPPAAWRLKPRPLRIAVEVSRGLPQRARFGRRWVDLCQVAGPQRIETGWWEIESESAGRAKTSAASPPIRRDYWYAELASGGAVSIFQDLNDRQWYLQGQMD